MLNRALLYPVLNSMIAQCFGQVSCLWVRTTVSKLVHATTKILEVLRVDSFMSCQLVATMDYVARLLEHSRDSVSLNIAFFHEHVDDIQETIVHQLSLRLDELHCFTNSPGCAILTRITTTLNTFLATVVHIDWLNTMHDTSTRDARAKVFQAMLDGISFSVVVNQASINCQLQASLKLLMPVSSTSSVHRLIVRALDIAIHTSDIPETATEHCSTNYVVHIILILEVWQNTSKLYRQHSNQTVVKVDTSLEVVVLGMLTLPEVVQILNQGALLLKSVYQGCSDSTSRFTFNVIHRNH